MQPPTPLAKCFLLVFSAESGSLGRVGSLFIDFYLGPASSYQQYTLPELQHPYHPKIIYLFLQYRKLSYLSLYLLEMIM